MAEELKACPFCGETLRINNARLAVHSRDSECLLRQQPIVVDDKDQVERWNTRATHPAAASVGGGEAVAEVVWSPSGTRHGAFKALDGSSLETGTKLYIHPADQVADGVAVSQTSLRNMADELECGASPDAVAERLRARLAKSEGEK